MEEIVKNFWKRDRKFWEVKRKIIVTKWDKSFRNFEKKIGEILRKL